MFAYLVKTEIFIIAPSTVASFSKVGFFYPTKFSLCFELTFLLNYSLLWFIMPPNPTINTAETLRASLDIERELPLYSIPRQAGASTTSE